MVKACIAQKTNYVDITGETYVSTLHVDTLIIVHSAIIIGASRLVLAWY